MEPINILQNTDSTTYITDTLNWVKLSGNFTANGGEKYLTIGNFKDGTRTHKVPLSTNFVSPCGSFANNFCYIYIDDVSLYACSGVGIYENEKENGFKLYPNPANTSITVELNTYDKTTIKIYNLMNELLIDTPVEKKTNIDVSYLSKGTYFYKVSNISGSIKTGKLIITQ